MNLSKYLIFISNECAFWYVASLTYLYDIGSMYGLILEKKIDISMISAREYHLFSYLYFDILIAFLIRINIMIQRTNFEKKATIQLHKFNHM